MKYSGTVIGSLTEIRFAYSGKIVFVGKQEGENVNQWEVVASLDRKPLQTELDNQLSDYEKTRAEFDLFEKNHPTDGDTAKFLKTGKQAVLNIAVKEVEQAKYKLDQADLVSPVSGLIVDIGGLVVGQNITPSNSPVKVLDVNSLKFVFEITQKDLNKFLQPQKAKISFEGIKGSFEGTSEIPFIGKSGKFEINIKVNDPKELLVGMIGQANFS